jgi:hypothetical protein
MIKTEKRGYIIFFSIASFSWMELLLLYDDACLPAL